MSSPKNWKFVGPTDDDTIDTPVEWKWKQHSYTQSDHKHDSHQKSQTTSEVKSEVLPSVHYHFEKEEPKEWEFHNHSEDSGTVPESEENYEYLLSPEEIGERYHGTHSIHYSDSALTSISCPAKMSCPVYPSEFCDFSVLYEDPAFPE